MLLCVRLVAVLALMGASFYNMGPTVAASPSPAPSPTFDTIVPMRPNDALNHPDALDHTKVALGPTNHGVSVSLTPPMLTTRVGDPMEVSLWITNTTNATRLFCVGDFYDYLRFEVVDSQNHPVGSRVPPDKEKPIPIRCMLPTLTQFRYVVPITDFVTLSSPGDYRVTAKLLASVAYRQQAWVSSNTITLRVTP